MTTWKFKTVDHEYEINEAPDLQRIPAQRRMVIRPRKATLHLVPGTNSVYGATIEGRLVRRDGELGGIRLIAVGIETEDWSYSAVPPPWIDKILADAGLEWIRRH